MKMIASFSLLAVVGVLFAGCAAHSEETCKPGDANAKPVAGAVNAVCPVGGDDATHSNVTTSYKGKTVALCCEGCKPKFDKMTDAQKDAALAKVAAK